MINASARETVDEFKGGYVGADDTRETREDREKRR
jgi:hypothetical protein